MSETMWNAIFMVGGALLSGFVGVLVSRWERSSQVRDDFADMINERMNMLDGNTFDAQCIYNASLTEFRTFMRKMRGNINHCAGRRLEKEWKHYQRMGRSPETLTKEKIAMSWEKMQKQLSAWF